MNLTYITHNNYLNVIHTDHEGDHIKADELIMDLLDKLGLAQTAKAYNQVSDKFWYA